MDKEKANNAPSSENKVDLNALFNPIGLENLGDAFQQLLKYSRENIGKKARRSMIFSRPSRYKEYPNAPRYKLIPPHKWELSFPYSIKQILERRKSVRSYSPKPLTLEQLSFLVWAATGISRREGMFPFRTAPSAGALYPIETYLSIKSVAGIPQGLYHYNVLDHALEQLKQSSTIHKDVARAALDQLWMADAAVIFILTAVVDRCKIKYGQRAYRYIYLDAGHISENLALAATAIDLKSCHVAAIFDDEVNGILGVDGLAETAIYLTAVGN